MMVEVMSRKTVLEYSRLQHDEKAAVLSIVNRNGAVPDLSSNSENGIDAHCTLYFDDVEFGMINCITDDNAKQTAAFVRDVAVNKDKLIVQCEYGVSRSAGVAAAIMMALTDDDSPIWKNARYRPNVTCYRQVLEAFHKAIDAREIREKVAANRNLYKTKLDKT